MNKLEVKDEELKSREAKDWPIASSYNDLQNQLDAMARWYLLRHPDFVTVVQDNDPALRGKPEKDAKEELLSYPWVVAIAAHEVAHCYYKERGEAGKVLARKLAEAAHSRTGMDIHPGTTIGENCFIDHGTGVVIGEKATIGKNTSIYHSVTLGACGGGNVNPNDRHPKIGDGCTISTGVKVLGNVTVGNDVTIGTNSLICGNGITIGNNVKIREGVRIMHGNHIADGVKIGAGAIIPENVGLIDKNIPADSYVKREGKELEILSLTESETAVRRFIQKIERMVQEAIGAQVAVA